MIYSARNKSKGYDSEWVVALALYSVIEMVSILEVMTPADWKDDYMNERCFALKSGNQSNGICICMASERCHGYSSCSFYKPMWKYERDEKRKFARLRSLPVDQQHTISEMYYNGNMPWADKSV